MTDWLNKFFIGLVLGILLFFLGYGIGIKAPEPKASRELELQIKREELKNLQLSNQIKEMALHGEEESDNAD